MIDARFTVPLAREQPACDLVLLDKASLRGGREMLWLLVLILLLLAVGGGIFLSKFLFIVLVVALLVAIFGRRSAV
jgi:hypothetical protein